MAIIRLELDSAVRDDYLGFCGLLVRRCLNNTCIGGHQQRARLCHLLCKSPDTYCCLHSPHTPGSATHFYTCTKGPPGLLRKRFSQHKHDAVGIVTYQASFSTHTFSPAESEGLGCGLEISWKLPHFIPNLCPHARLAKNLH